MKEIEPMRQSATAYFAMKMKDGKYRYVQQKGKVFRLDKNNKPVINLISCIPLNSFKEKTSDGVFVEIFDGQRKKLEHYENKLRLKARNFLLPIFKPRHFSLLDAWFEERLSRDISSLLLSEKLNKSEETIRGYRREILKLAREHFHRDFENMDELIPFLEGGFWQ